MNLKNLLPFVRSLTKTHPAQTNADLKAAYLFNYRYAECDHVHLLSPDRPRASQIDICHCYYWTKKH